MMMIDGDDDDDDFNDDNLQMQKHYIWMQKHNHQLYVYPPTRISIYSSLSLRMDRLMDEYIDGLID